MGDKRQAGLMASTGQEQATSLPLHWGQYENNPHQSQFLLSTLSSNLLSDMPPWEKLVPQKKNRSKETSLITMKGFSSFEFLKPQSHLFLAFKRILDWSKQLKGNLFAFSLFNLSLARDTSLARSVSHVLQIMCPLLV